MTHTPDFAPPMPPASRIAAEARHLDELLRLGLLDVRALDLSLARIRRDYLCAIVGIRP